MSQPIRVLIVDDSSFIRSMLKRLIEKDPRLQVVDTAVNGEEGVKKAMEIKPDVVTMDVEMPVMDGLTALRLIMEKDPRPVVMVSSLTENGAEATMKALASGAVDFLPKALQDHDRNIMNAAGNLHDKLVAAAGANVGVAARPVAPPPPRPVAQPAQPVQPQQPMAQPQPQATPAPQPVAPQPAAAPIGAYKAVIMGTSTGGPKCLEELLPAYPILPVPTVIVQHMPAAFTGPMAARLNARSTVEVAEAQHNQTLRPGVVYIAPGGRHIHLSNVGGALVANISDEPTGVSFRPSVGVLAGSARAVLGGQVVGVMLSGMGNDGAAEFKALKDAGAHIITQDQASALVYGMPKAVKEAGGANEELSTGQIPARLQQLVS